MTKDDSVFDPDTLKTSRADLLASGLRGVLGAVPMVGPVVAEITTSLIPNQRFDRLGKLFEALERRVCHLEKSIVRERLTTPERVDLFEDACWQAARAMSEERIEHIANLLVHGIAEEDVKVTEQKFLMSILGQLSDEEVILLVWMNMAKKDEEFERTHATVVKPPAGHFGSTQDALDDETLYESRKEHLRALGLIRPEFRRTIKQQVPPIDELTGRLKVARYDVTRLGRLFLRSILADDQHGW